MPLGMMAKDSIQDFTLLLGDAEADKLTEIPHDKDDNAAVVADDDGGLEAVALISSSNNNNKQQIMSSNSDDATTSSAGSCCSAASPANPQQAQEEDEDAGQRSPDAAAAPRLPQRTQEQQSQQQQQQQSQYAGFKSDYWGQQYYNNNNNNALQRNMKNTNTYAGAYDSSYFYDPYATTTTTSSGISSVQRSAAAAANNNMFLLDRNKQQQQQSQQLFTMFRCLLPCLFPWQQQHQQLPPPLTSHHRDAGLLSLEAAAADASAVAIEKETTTTTREKPGDSESAAAAAVDDAEEEVASNASETLGEKLSDRERQAVLARLRLAQPETEDENKKTGITENSGEISSRNVGVGGSNDNAAGAVEATSSSSKGLLPESPPEKPLKGILKRRTTMMTKANQDAQAATAAAASTASIGTPSSDATADGGGGSKKTPPPGAGPRRSLFPQYSYDSYGPSGGSGDLDEMASSVGMGQHQRRTKRHHTTFAPMARVMTVKSKNDMTPEEKGDIWWVKSDYEDFRKAGRIIARAMVEGGSEIWLAFSRSCRAAAKKKKKEEQAKMNKSNGDGNVEKVSSDDTDGDDDDDDDNMDLTAISCDKWWHEFGHSRRGLEHVVSIDEGRQRQQNVRNAIQAVLEEQARQKLYRRQVDADKLRKISLQYTTWARDLALASGSSDADAVKSSFADSRKSREFYLSELITTNSSTSISSTAAATKSTAAANTSATTATTVTIPDFMRASSLQESSSVRQTIAAPTADILDANTAAQIRYRRKKNKDAAADKKASSSTNATTTLTSEEPVHDGPLSSISISSGGSSNIDDVGGSNKPESMAHRAAGFSAEGDAKISAAAVLSGMGAVPRNSNEVISTAC